MEKDIILTDATRAIVDAYLQKRSSHSKTEKKIIIKISDKKEKRLINAEEANAKTRQEIEEVLNQFQQLEDQIRSFQSNNRYSTQRGLMKMAFDRMTRHLTRAKEFFIKFEQETK